MMRRDVATLITVVALEILTSGCFSQATIGPQVTVETIRHVQVGMSRSEVERLLGSPVAVERRDEKFYGAGAETMIYFRRLPVPMQYPMLWVHLRDGKVEEVYAKRQHMFDSWGVYGLSNSRQWETADFTKTFPTSSASR